MSWLFYSLTNFNAEISGWDTSSVTNMFYMFYSASAFNQPLSFDTSSVTGMIDMFAFASAFNQPLSFDTSSVITMSNMFNGANSLSAPNKLLIRCAWAGTAAFASAGYGSSWAPGTCPTTFTTKASLRTAVQVFNANPTAATAKHGPIADWDVSAITDMSWLFSGLRNFNADISGWDTSSVTTMYRMFYSATAFNQPLSFDTSSVTNMRYMFSDAHSLSATNKLLTRCAWAGTAAFRSAGYVSGWAPGSCA